MKLLVVSRGVKPISPELTGGAEHVLWRLAEEAARRGHEVHVVTDYARGLTTHPRITLHNVGIPNWIGSRLRKSGFLPWIFLHLLGNALATRKALSVMKAQARPFDAVHSHGNLSAWLLSCFRGDAPLVYTEHDSTPWSCSYPNRIQRIVRKALYSVINARAYKRSDLIVVLYEEQKREIAKRWHIPLDRIEVVPNGVDTQTFTPSPVGSNGQASTSSRLASGVPASGFCLFVGRLESRKGADLLIRALSKVQGSPSCVIAGDGPERPRLEALALRLGVGDKVHFLGEIKHKELPDLYRRSTFFALPSLAEAFPLTALEAMASGAPVVVSAVGAARSLVTSTGCGLLFSPGDANDLAHKISAMMSSPESARRMGDQGRTSAVERFSWERVGAQVTAIYGSIAPASNTVILVAGDAVSPKT